MWEKCKLGLIVGLLFCSVAASEFPELVKLIDNPTNDFVVSIASGELKPSAEAAGRIDVDASWHGFQQEESLGHRPEAALVWHLRDLIPSIESPHLVTIIQT